MAKLPKKPKKPKVSSSVAVWKRYEERFKKWNDKIKQKEKDKAEKERIVKKYS